ncbi:MAG: DUF1700 domain-containing protein [Eubacteriaceae bacterium]|nr:DUF1700 domain-containing protein [Eubacteriaceae bacterium]
MGRREFIDELERRLRKLPNEEINEALEFYEQYFDEAGSENEGYVLAELGSPASVASQIIASYAAKDKETGKRRLSTVWIAILAIFASPIALPLSITAAVVSFSLIIVVISLIIAIGAAGIGLLLGGALCALLSFTIIISSFGTALLVLGIGFILLGLGMSILSSAIELARLASYYAGKLVGKFILRRSTAL